MVLEEAFGVQSVWTLDGSWRHIDKVGMVAASAAARHDGLLVGGRLEVDADGMPLNAYLGELAAQVDWAHAEGARRVMVGFDAVSPVLALLRFRSMHDRSRSASYRDDWLASFSAELRLERFDVVIFYHLKSHTGISLNEYADKEAGVAASTEFYRTIRGVGRAAHASAYFGAFRGDRQKAERVFGAAVRARLRAESVNTQWLEPGDLRVPLRSASEEETLWLLASQRLFPADKKYHGERQAAMQVEQCPCGCGVYGWANAFLRCTELRLEREAVVAALQAGNIAMTCRILGVVLRQ